MFHHGDHGDNFTERTEKHLFGSVLFRCSVNSVVQQYSDSVAT